MATSIAMLVKMPPVTCHGESKLYREALLKHKQYHLKEKDCLVKARKGVYISCRDILSSRRVKRALRSIFKTSLEVLSPITWLLKPRIQFTSSSFLINMSFHASQSFFDAF